MKLYRATVLSNEDTKTYQLQVQVPGLGGNAPLWAWPALLPGSGMQLPKVRSKVWILSPNGSADDLIWLGEWVDVGAGDAAQLVGPGGGGPSAGGREFLPTYTVIDDGGTTLNIDMPFIWGIRDEEPYHNPEGVPNGEEALLVLTEDGWLLRPLEVH